MIYFPPPSSLKWPPSPLSAHVNIKCFTPGQWRDPRRLWLTTHGASLLHISDNQTYHQLSSGMISGLFCCLARFIISVEDCKFYENIKSGRKLPLLVWTNCFPFTKLTVFTFEEGICRSLNLDRPHPHHIFSLLWSMEKAYRRIL